MDDLKTMKENEYQKPENPMAEGSNRKDIAEPNSQMSAKAQDSPQSSFDDSNSEKAMIDSLFRRVIANATLLAFILQQCLPEFYHYSVRQIVDWMQKVTESIVELLDPRFSFGGHNLIADTLSAISTPFQDAYGSETSKYLVNVEMQLNANPGYPLERRGFWYSIGILAGHYVEKLYGITPQLIELWLVPQKYAKKRIDCIPVPAIGSANADVLTSFFQDPKAWYTKANEAILRNCRNNPVATVLFVKFGIPNEDSSLLAKVLYQVFLVDSNKRDYAFLNSLGIVFTEEEKQSMDELFAKTNVFYETGFESGKEEGKAEERDSILENARNLGPEVLAAVQKAIEYSNK